MKETGNTLTALFNRIPRRHTPENVKELYDILNEYEDVLQNIEAESPQYEQLVPPFFDALDPIRATVKKSSDNKASKKTKDSLFGEASGTLKDSMSELMELYES